MTDFFSISELAPRLRRREISPVEITRDCLARIERMNPSLNAFITVMSESAMEQARRAEGEIGCGEWRGALHGVPVALKDLIDTAGVRTTAASALYKDRVPGDDADVVRRLWQAGAVIVGKNNLHEFAYGGSSLVSYFGDVHNPWDVGRIAGGSSGGSAAAVTAGLVYAAIGTDTAGSIREPAALCGCVGIKPTYGRVSSRGVIPLSTSLDHVGPLAATVEDAALVLQAIAGYDSADVTSVDVPVADYVSALREGVKGMRVGVPRGYFYRRPRCGSGFGDGTRTGWISEHGSKVTRRATRCAGRPHVASGGIVCVSRGERCQKSAVVSGGDFAADPVGRESDCGGVHTAAARTIRSAAGHSSGIRGCGCSGDSDDADARSGHRRSESESRCAASGRTQAAAEHAAF